MTSQGRSDLRDGGVVACGYGGRDKVVVVETAQTFGLRFAARDITFCGKHVTFDESCMTVIQLDLRHLHVRSRLS